MTAALCRVLPRGVAPARVGAADLATGAAFLVARGGRSTGRFVDSPRPQRVHGARVRRACAPRKAAWLKGPLIKRVAATSG